MEIRKNEGGSIDEIVGEGKFHLEQMGRDFWCLILEDEGGIVCYSILSQNSDAVLVMENWKEDNDK